MNSFGIDWICFLVVIAIGVVWLYCRRGRKQTSGRMCCSWCGGIFSGSKKVGQIKDPQKFDGSHGICSECKKKVEKERDEYLKGRKRKDGK